MPRRTIHDNTRLLQDVVDYCTLEGVPAALISLDQEKARRGQILGGSDRVNVGVDDGAFQLTTGLLETLV